MAARRLLPLLLSAAGQDTVSVLLDINGMKQPLVIPTRGAVDATVAEFAAKHQLDTAALAAASVVAPIAVASTSAARARHAAAESEAERARPDVRGKRRLRDDVLQWQRRIRRLTMPPAVEGASGRGRMRVERVALL